MTINVWQIILLTMLQINGEDFKKEVLDYKGAVVVDFFAEWCGPCKIMAPILSELSAELKDIKFVKVDVDQNQELSSQYSVFSIPTFVVFKNGVVSHQFSGAMGKESFSEEIKKTSA